MRLWVVGFLGVLLVAGCGGGAEPPPEQAEKTEGAEEGAAEKTNSPAERTAEQQTVAQAPANPQEEWMASEEGQAAAARERSRRDAQADFTMRERSMMALLDCQLRERYPGIEQAGRAEGEARMVALYEEFEASGHPNLQTMLAEQGYDCGGNFDEVLDQYPPGP